MFIKRYFYLKNKKRTAILFIASIFISTMFMSFFNAPNNIASALTQESKDRQIVAAFGFCITNSIATSLDNYTKFSEIFDDGGTFEYAVVDLGIEQDGVMTCNDVTDRTIVIFEDAGMLVAGNSTDSVPQRFEKTIFGDTLRSGGNTGFEDSFVEGKLEDFRKNVIQPYIDARPINDQEMAERLLNLADFCYYYSNSAINNADFTATDSTNKTIYGESDNRTDSEVVNFMNIRKNNGFGTSTKTELGKIDLGWQMMSRSSGNSHFNYGSDWYPLGQDFYNFDTKKEDKKGFFTEDYRHFNAILDCNAVKKVKDRIFPFYKLDPTDGETLMLSDGRTASDIIDQGEPDVGLGLGNGNDNPTCESSGFSLSWIMCPIINGSLDAMDWMFKQFIEPFLFTQPLKTVDSTGNSTIPYQIWKSFRTIGNIMLLFGLLIVVLSQTIGGGLLDAYAIKKAVPRIFLAAILINLSYYGVSTLVDIFNVIGKGAGRLITSPLADSASFSFTPNNLVNSGGLLAFVLGGAFVIHMVNSGGFLMLLLLLVILPMLITVAAVFGTILMRRGIILTIAILSPVLAALFMLPSTEKYAKQSFGLLIKTLIVYPIIMVIFGVADVMSVMFMNVSSTNSGLGGFAQSSIQQFIGLIVLFVPFFLIPFSFKFAGGVLGSISGGISGLGKKGLQSFKGNEFDMESRLVKARGAYNATHTSRTSKNAERIERIKDAYPGNIFAAARRRRRDRRNQGNSGGGNGGNPPTNTGGGGGGNGGNPPTNTGGGGGGNGGTVILPDEDKNDHREPPPIPAGQVSKWVGPEGNSVPDGRADTTKDILTDVATRGARQTAKDLGNHVVHGSPAVQLEQEKQQEPINAANKKRVAIQYEKMGPGASKGVRGVINKAKYGPPPEKTNTNDDVEIKKFSDNN